MKPRTRISLTLLFTFLLLSIPRIAYAHEGPVGLGGSFLAGLVHPVLGPDHLLAMLSVGILSAQIGGRAIWTVPATFVGVMFVGGLIGLLVPGFTLVEAGIALSVIALGAAIAAERSIPITVAMVFVGIFALFHGYAHGIEMPQTAQPALYALGFMTGTALIHIVGVVIGDIARQYERGKSILRFGGGLIAIVGVLFILGIA